nr:leucine-rich repeat protein [uncultured Ruminococcus sp.]
MKRLFTLFLALLLVFGCAVCVTAADADLSDTGKNIVTIGDWVMEKIDKGTHWEMDEYVGPGGEVVVPWQVSDIMVVSLGDHCFANNTNVTSVVTTSPPWRIGEYCFIDCMTLEKIELNNMIDTIGVGAFSGTSSLKDINLQDSIVTEIKPYTFLNSAIEEVALPKTCTTLGAYSFGQCTQLSKVTIPKSVTTIHEDAFKGSNNVVIYCYSNSAAHHFAEAKGIDYVLLDAYTFILGDADGDGEVTVSDVTVLQRVLAGMTDDPDGMIALRGTITGDKLDITHVTMIQRHLANLEYDSDVPIGTQVTRYL